MNCTSDISLTSICFIEVPQLIKKRKTKNNIFFITLLIPIRKLNISQL